MRKAFQQIICARLLGEGIVGCNCIGDLAVLDLLSGEMQLGESRITSRAGLGDRLVKAFSASSFFLSSLRFSAAENSAPPALGGAYAGGFENLVATDARGR